MKKKFYILLFAMLISFGVSAQRFEYQLGMKGALGFDWPSVDMDDLGGKENGFCYKYGFTGIYYFGENYGITSGFNIMGNRFAYDYKIEEQVAQTRDIVEYNVNHKLTYFQIPVLLKMRTDSFANRFRFLGEIGYGMDIRVNGECKVNNVKIDNPYRDVCSSFIVHLGVEMGVMSRSTLQFIIAYDTFFTNIQTMSNDKLTLSNLCFELGFLF